MPIVRFGIMCCILFCRRIQENNETLQSVVAPVKLVPANTIHWTNVRLIMVQHLQRWTSINLTLVQRLGFVGMNQGLKCVIEMCNPGCLTRWLSACDTPVPRHQLSPADTHFLTPRAHAHCPGVTADYRALHNISLSWYSLLRNVTDDTICHQYAGDVTRRGSTTRATTRATVMCPPRTEDPIWIFCSRRTHYCSPRRSPRCRPSPEMIYQITRRVCTIYVFITLKMHVWDLNLVSGGHCTGFFSPSAFPGLRSLYKKKESYQ